MNKIHRINGRKVVLSYFYARLISEEVEELLKEIGQKLSCDTNDEEGRIEFVNKLGKRLTEEEINLVKDIYLRYLQERNIKVEINLKDFKIYKDENFEEDMYYIVNNFFRLEKQKGIDIEYVFKIGKCYSKYKDEVGREVNKYAKSFKFEEMDEVDRAIFLLGYIEFKELSTPREVILNEMIELAKRYGDEGSYKLINGIGHYLLSDND